MAIVLALVTLLVFAGLFIGRTVIRSNYYVAENNGAVSILRGVQGSLLGMPLHEPYRMACLDVHNSLSVIDYDDVGTHPNCRPMQLRDLRPAARNQVQAGLPAGSLDNAIGELHELSNSSLLPPCPPPRETAHAAGPPPGPPPLHPSAPTTTAPASGSNRPPPASPGPPGAPAPPSTAAASASALAPPEPQPGVDCRAVA